MDGRRRFAVAAGCVVAWVAAAPVGAATSAGSTSPNAVVGGGRAVGADEPRIAPYDDVVLAAVACVTDRKADRHRLLF